MEKSYNRINVSMSDSLHDKIEAYADMMGVSLSEAARHLMLRGLEQVQALVNARDSVDALNRMTSAFDKGLEQEEKVFKSGGKPKLGRPRKSVEGLVTPPQSLKNETKSPVKDMF